MGPGSEREEGRGTAKFGDGIRGSLYGLKRKVRNGSLLWDKRRRRTLPIWIGDP